MRICLISNYNGINDEGIKNVSYHLYTEMEKNHDILHINSRSIFNINSLKKIRQFDPEIIHIILRPTLCVLTLSGLIKFYLGTPVIISALQSPSNNFINRTFLSLAKPNLFLTQSIRTENILKKMGANVYFLPNGIDIDRFIQVPNEYKDKLRKKYNIDNKKFILLHVGHINKGRNLSILTNLNKCENVQVIIIGSTNLFNFDESVYYSLIEKGCIVWRRYFDHIEEMYQLADCYIFPTFDENYCIEIPLSILEAMACNLPIITTMFGALNRLFSEGDGLFFINSGDEILKILQTVINKKVGVLTRMKIMEYRWDNIFESLEKIYMEIGARR